MITTNETTQGQMKRQREEANSHLIYTVMALVNHVLVNDVCCERCVDARESKVLTVPKVPTIHTKYE